MALLTPATLLKCVALLSFVAAMAAAQQQTTVPKEDSPIPFPCMMHWTEPSASNELKCDDEYLKSITDVNANHGYIYLYLIPIPLVFSFLVLLPLSCLICLCRSVCNCCGSSKYRPSHFCGGSCCGPDDDSDLVTFESSTGIHGSFSAEGAMMQSPNAALMTNDYGTTAQTVNQAEGLMMGRVMATAPANYNKNGYSQVDNSAGAMYYPDGNVPSNGMIPYYYTPRSLRKFHRVCVFFAVLGFIGVCANAASGALLSTQLQHVDVTVNDYSTWALQLVADIKAGIADPNDPNKFPPGFDAAIFNDVEDNIHSYTNDVQNYVVDYRSNAVYGIIAVCVGLGIVPMVLFGLFSFCATFIRCCGRSMRFCLFPCAVASGYILQFLYGFLTSVALVFILALAVVRSDITSTNPAEQRSFLQWYVVPYCEEQTSFASLEANVHEIVTDATTSGCRQLLEFCSPSEVYDTNNADIIFYCNLTSPSTDCPDVASVAAIMKGMHIKTSVPAFLACGANISTADCDLKQCSESCTIEKAKTGSQEALSELATGERAMHTIDTLVLPWMSCPRLITKALDIGVLTLLRKLTIGTILFAFGCLFVGISILGSIAIAYSGNKRWATMAAYQDSNTALTVAPRHMAAAQESRNSVSVPIAEYAKY